MSQSRQLPVTALAAELKDQSIPLAQANIWDVRDHSAYLEGHLEGAVNQPVEQGFTPAMLADLTGPLYVLCGGGSKAPRAAALITELNPELEVVILSGGTRQAKAEGLTIVNGEAVYSS